MSTLQTAVAKLRAKRQPQGPKTDAGKKISSRNSMKHGLRSENPVGPNESIEEWESHLDDCMRSRAPTDDQEREVVLEIAICKWKMASCMCYEHALVQARTRREVSARLNEPAFPKPTPEEEADYALRLVNLIDAGFHSHPALRDIDELIEGCALPEDKDLGNILRYRTMYVRRLEKAEARLDRLKEGQERNRGRNRPVVQADPPALTAPPVAPLVVTGAAPAALPAKPQPAPTPAPVPQAKPAAVAAPAPPAQAPAEPTRSSFGKNGGTPIPQKTSAQPKAPVNGPGNSQNRRDYMPPSGVPTSKTNDLDRMFREAQEKGMKSDPRIDQNTPLKR